MIHQRLRQRRKKVCYVFSDLYFDPFFYLFLSFLLVCEINLNFIKKGQKLKLTTLFELCSCWCRTWTWTRARTWCSRSRSWSLRNGYIQTTKLWVIDKNAFLLLINSILLQFNIIIWFVCFCGQILRQLFFFP